MEHKLASLASRARLFEYLRQADVVMRAQPDTSDRAPSAHEAARFIETAQQSWR